MSQQRLEGECLLQHLRQAHLVQLRDDALLQSLRQQAAYVHAAMHSGRAHPGHFHYHDLVLHLWEETGHIHQVNTHGRT